MKKSFFLVLLISLIACKSKKASVAAKNDDSQVKLVLKDVRLYPPRVPYDPNSEFDEIDEPASIQSDLNTLIRAFEQAFTKGKINKLYDAVPRGKEFTRIYPEYASLTSWQLDDQHIKAIREDISMNFPRLKGHLINGGFLVKKAEPIAIQIAQPEGYEGKEFDAYFFFSDGERKVKLVCEMMHSQSNAYLKRIKETSPSIEKL